MGGPVSLPSWGAVQHQAPPGGEGAGSSCPISHQLQARALQGQSRSGTLHLLLSGQRKCPGEAAQVPQPEARPCTRNRKGRGGAAAAAAGATAPTQDTPEAPSWLWAPSASRLCQAKSPHHSWPQCPQLKARTPGPICSPAPAAPFPLAATSSLCQPPHNDRRHLPCQLSRLRPEGAGAGSSGLAWERAAGQDPEQGGQRPLKETGPWL